MDNPRLEADDTLLRSLVARLEAVRFEATLLDMLPAARLIALRIDQALKRLHTPEALQQPLRITLLGGTGVGKSKLFSTLLGKPDASPSSDAIRCFTTEPVVAVTPEDRALVKIPENFRPRYVAGVTPGVVLIDTPDVDGMLRENRDVARAMIEDSDLVLYVTDVDKRANFDILQEARDWGERKRWLFVLNKLDRAEKDREAICADFDRILRQAGFEPNDQVRFLISAEQPDRFDFPRLQQVLTRRPHQGFQRLLRTDAFLGHAEYALQPDLLGPIDQLVQTLRHDETKLNQRVHRAYLTGMREPAAAETFALVIRESAWRQLGNRAGPMMALPILVRCRFGMLWIGFRAGRLLTSGMSIFGLLGVAFSSLWLTAQGLLPLRQIVEAFGTGYRRELEDVATDARRTLEDHGLGSLIPPEEPVAAKPPPPATERKATDLQTIAQILEEGITKLTTGDTDRKILSQLSADVATASQKVARWTTGGFLGGLLVLIANLIPAAMLGWVLYRLGMNWWNATYLPAGFYGMAIALGLASLLPGMALLGWRLNARVRRLEPAELIHAVEEPQATERLRGVRQRLEQFRQRARQLRRSILEYRDTLQQEAGLETGGLGSHASSEYQAASYTARAGRNGAGE